MEKLKNNKDKYKTILERYKKVFIMYKEDEKANKMLYEDTKKQLNNIFLELFIIENEIEQKSNTLLNKLTKNNKKINNNKEIYEKNKGKLDNIITINKANKPREEGFKEKLTNEYIYLSINMIGILINFGLIYKIFK
jgi:hypothetical protein